MSRDMLTAVLVSGVKIAKVATLLLIGLATSTLKSGNVELATLAMWGWQSWQPCPTLCASVTQSGDARRVTQHIGA
jgi:hypothetical protein